MVVTWYGQGCFTITASRNSKEQIKIVIDPFSPEIGLKPPKGEADLLLVSHDHYDHNFVEAVSGSPFIIREPGEYEVKDVFVQGVPAFHDNRQGKERGKVVLFKIEAEGVKVCHLSDLGQDMLTDGQIEKIGAVDVLLIPVGGVYTIDGIKAHEIVNQISPRIVIPMHYALPGLKIKLEGPEKFLKAMGAGKIEPEPKFKISQSGLPGEDEETRVVALMALR